MIQTLTQLTLEQNLILAKVLKTITNPDMRDTFLNNFRFVRPNPEWYNTCLNKKLFNHVLYFNEICVPVNSGGQSFSLISTITSKAQTTIQYNNQYITGFNYNLNKIINGQRTFLAWYVGYLPSDEIQIAKQQLWAEYAKMKGWNKTPLYFPEKAQGILREELWKTFTKIIQNKHLYNIKNIKEP